MPPIPGSNRLGLGQGIPGGRAGLPPSLGGGSPPPGLPRVAPTFSAPAMPAPGLTAPARPQTQLVPEPPSKKAYSLAEAMAILDKVRAGSMEPTHAQSLLKSLGTDERQQLALMVHRRADLKGDLGISVQAQLQALNVGPAAKKLNASGGHQTQDYAGAGQGVGSHLFSDIGQTVVGALPGIALTAKAAGQDVGALAQAKKPTHLYNEILKPIGKQYAETYGHGAGGFLKSFKAHPLAPILDAAAVFSAGAGTAARLSKATTVVRAGTVKAAAEGAKHVAEVGKTDPLKIYPLKNGLYQVRDSKGKIIASRLPDEKSAIAHAQSIATGGVSKTALERVKGETLYHGGPAKLEGGKLKANADPGAMTSKDIMGGGLYTSTSKSVAKSYSLFHDGGVVHKLTVDPDTILDANKPMPPKVQKAFDKLHPDFPISTKGVPLQQLLDIHEISDELQDALSKQGYHGISYPAFTDSEDIAAAYDAAGKDPNSPEARAAIKGLEGSREHVIWNPDKAFIGGYRPGTPASRASLALKGATRGGAQGSLIDMYERARGITHEAETQQIMTEVASVLDNPNLRLTRRTIRETARDVAQDLRQTAIKDVNNPARMASEHPDFLSSKAVGTTLTAGGVALREASDLIRAGAIYLRPAYLPNNWAGNTFMNVTHQGVFAPINLGKSLVMDKYIGTRYTRAIDRSMGANAAELVTSAKGRGYVGSLTQPAAHVMGAIADQPFRRAAWLHEARKLGHTKLSDVQKLLDRAAAEGADGGPALHEVAEIGRKAQEEIVKFGHMNDIERSVLRNLVFVYSWMRGAGRYAGRFPLQHPIQTAVGQHLGQVGNDWLQKEMGGVPSFLVGAIPVGRDSKGNPILINPFSLNPLGTGLDILRAASGTAKVLSSDPTQFNKYAQSDIISLLNPLAQSYLQAREGGKPVSEQGEHSIAVKRLYDELKHPGSGSIYPTSRKEAIGHFVGGSLYPRVADQAAITRSLERENANNPLALIPHQMEQFKKTTGQDIPQEFVDAYKADLAASAQQRDFQKNYAKDHGQSGFRSLPPQNKAEAALDYLKSHKLVSGAELKSMQDSLKAMTTDEEFNSFANALWGVTGAGSVKRAWDDMIRSAKTTQLTRKR